MYIVAITGNAGSGKSSLCKAFNNIGIPVLSADNVNQELIEHCGLLPQYLNKITLTDTSNRNGNIDKNKLRPLVFNNPDLRKALESFLHPLIHDNLIMRSEVHPANSYLVLEIPLLFETSSHYDQLDFVILVTADTEILYQRISARSSLTADEARTILNTQIPDRDKFSSSNAIVVNNGDIDSLQPIASKLHQHLTSILELKT